MFYINVSKNRKKIYHKYINDKGKRVVETVDFKPKLYFKAKEGEQVDGYSLNNRIPLKALELDDVKEYSALIRKYKDIGSLWMYGDIDPVYQFISEKYHDSVDFDFSKFRVLFIDIETYFEIGTFPDAKYAQYPILSMAAYDSLDQTKHVWGYKEQIELDDGVQYHHCENEKHMLEEFIKFWKKDLYPDIVVGWNSTKFDIPYIYNRIGRLFDEGHRNILSPVRRTFSYEKSDKYFRKYQVVNIYGVSHIDLMTHYEKFPPRSRDSLSLDYVSEYELGENKVDYSDYGNLMDLYKLNYEMFCKYNYRDVDLMVRIDNKINLLELITTIAYLARVNFDDPYSPVKTWDAFIHHYIKQHNLVLEPKRQNDKIPYEGAYVKDPIVGLHKWIVSADVASMYPNLIRALNMGNETITDDPSEDNVTISASGNFFRKDEQSNYSEMITDVYNNRKIARKKMNEKKQLLNKIRQEIEKRENTV